MALSHPPLSLTESASQSQSIYLTSLSSLWLTVGTTPSSHFDQTTCFWVASQVLFQAAPVQLLSESQKPLRTLRTQEVKTHTCVISPRSGLGLFYTQVTPKALASITIISNHN